jgi:hypothetical protein
MKAQAPKISDDQVITQAIKARCAGLLHSNLVRERPKTVPGLYEQFAKFSKSKIQHFHKLEQQRKVSKADKAPKPRHNESQRTYPKPMHNINSDGCGPPENWEKNYGMPSHQTRHNTTSNQRSNQYNQRGGSTNRGQVVVEAHMQPDLRTACTTVMRQTIAPKIAPSTLSQKRR